METFRIFLPASSLQIGLVHLHNFLNMIPAGFNVCTPVLYKCLVLLCKNSFDCLYSHLFTMVSTSLSDQEIFPRAFLSGPRNGTIPCLPMFQEVVDSAFISSDCVLRKLSCYGLCHHRISWQASTSAHAYACVCLTLLLVFQWQRPAHVASSYCSILWYTSYMIW